MARTKPTTTVEPDAEEPAPVAEVEELPPEAAENPDSPEAAPGVVRKPLGTKEVIPFKWKLVGRAGDMIVTLFKAVEQEDVQAQFERLGREGYYVDLQILDVNAKIEQPKPARPVAKAKPPKEIEKPSKPAKSKEPAAKPKPTKQKAPVAVAAKAAPRKKAPAAKPSKATAGKKPLTKKK